MRSIFFLSLLLFPGSAGAQSDAGAELKETRDRLKVLEDRLNKLEGAPAKTSLSAFNPAMGISLDTVFSDANDKANFLFRSAEVNLEAPIDPFLKGWVIINGKPAAVEIEEAALQTTSLPWNLTLTGGRMFAAFGRLAQFHDHELPVTERPRSLDTFIGGETQADGLEAAFLFPTPFYLSGTFGVYNKIGGENARADNAAGRPLEESTYLGRLAASTDLGASHGLELGVDSAWTPKRSRQEDVAVTGSVQPSIVTRKNTWRTLSGADLTYRYQPAQGGVYRGAIWGTEVMMNNERRFNAATRLPTDRVRAYSGFSYLQVKLGRRWRPGALVDLAEDLDDPQRLTRTGTAFLSCDVTEFHRVRLSYSVASSNAAGLPKNHIVALQWTGVLGRHVHGFRDR